MTRPTPETDRVERYGGDRTHEEWAIFARQLENDRDALREDAERYRKLKEFALPGYLIMAQGEFGIDKQIIVMAESWEALDATLTAKEPR